MKYRSWIILLVVIGIALGAGVYLVVYSFGDKHTEQGNYEATRTEANVNNTEGQNVSQTENDNNDTQENDGEQPSEQAQAEQSSPVETEIASFSTKIVTKDSSRQKNIEITCNTLNGTIVEPNATFSFCNTVGQATTQKGYEKADIFDAKRK